MGIFLMNEMKDLIWVSRVFSLIKTITKFLILNGYQQPDFSINWTVMLHKSCLQLDSTRHFARAEVVHFVE